MAHTNPFTPPASPVGPGTVVYGFAVTPSDATVFATLTRYIYVGTTGDLAVRLAGDTTAVTLSSVPAGAMLALCCAQVMSTNTTADDIVALY